MHFDSIYAWFYRGAKPEAQRYSTSKFEFLFPITPNIAIKGKTVRCHIHALIVYSSYSKAQQPACINAGNICARATAENLLITELKNTNIFFSAPPGFGSIVG